MIGGLGFILNIPLNYFFIFSMDLGGIGCGVATALVSWIGLIVLWLATLFLKNYKESYIYENFYSPILKIPWKYYE